MDDARTEEEHAACLGFAMSVAENIYRARVMPVYSELPCHAWAGLAFELKPDDPRRILEN